MQMQWNYYVVMCIVNANLSLAFTVSDLLGPRIASSLLLLVCRVRILSAYRDSLGLRYGDGAGDTVENSSVLSLIRMR